MKFEVGKYYLHIKSGDPNTFVFKVIGIDDDGIIKREYIKYLKIVDESWISVLNKYIGERDTGHHGFYEESSFAQGCRELTKEEVKNIWLYEI